MGITTQEGTKDGGEKDQFSVLLVGNEDAFNMVHKMS